LRPTVCRQPARARCTEATAGCFALARTGEAIAVTKRTGNTEQSRDGTQGGANGGRGRDHDPKQMLSIYLDDHWAGAGAGSSLANRLAAENEGTQWYADIRRVADAIDEDQRTLRRLRETYAGGGFSVKRALAQGAERVGRLKLNGSLIGYTPLARVLELEALIAGVKSKRLLWRSLRRTDAAQSVDLDHMESRAKEQLDMLISIHKEASAIAFAVREPTQRG
jgi:hypothetical protein